MISLGNFVFVIILSIQIRSLAAAAVSLQQNEFDNFVKTQDIRCVYFQTKDAPTIYPSFSEEFAKSGNSLESYGVQLGKVDCSIDKSVKYCSNISEPSLLVFRNGKLLKKLPISRLKDEHAIVANILHRFLLKDELNVVKTADDFEAILSKAKGKENLILVNVKTIEMREHRNLLEVAFAYGDSFKFYLSSKLPRDMYGDESNVKAFLCKEKDCAVRHYDGEFKVISLASFIQSLTLPLAIILDQDQKIPYADENLVSIPINQVFMFVSNIDDTEKYRSELEDVAKNMKSAVGFIVVLVEHHPTFIRQFGLAEDSHYPALGFVPGHKSKLDEEEFSYADVFTSSEASLVTDKLADFVSNLITSPQRLADQDENRSFTVNFPMEYLRLLRDLDADYMLVAICKSSVEVCGDFSHNFQRLSRTFDRHFRRRNTGKRNIKFSFIYTERDMDPKFEIKSYPTVRLHKKGDPVTKFLPLEGPYYYDQLVEFVQAEINENDVIMLPKSFLDHADLERVSEDGNTVVGDVHDAETSERTNEEDEEQEERPPEELEDDEVAVAGYEIYYTKAVNDSHVPKLNDTSFNRTVTKFDISVVFFFLPWDARSQAFSPSYAGAAKKLVETDGSDVKIGVHQVNCFDWEDVCGKENIISYPTIRIYRRNQLPIDYNGILDETSLIKTVKLLQTTSPVKLPSDGEVDGFRDGEYPMPSILYTDVSIIGLFSDENSEHVAFISAAHKMEGQFLCGYVVGKIAFDMASRFGVNVPSIVLIKRNDPLETQVVFEGEYTAEAIVSFVKHSSLPKYGELTPLNFPSYFSKGKPFLIAFIGKGNAEINSLISDVAKSKDSGRVNYCWVDTSLKVNRDILESYTKNDLHQSQQASTIVLVNHYKGTVYTYSGELRKENLISWIENCLTEAVDFTGKLEAKEWKPRLEGYDFLAKIQEEAEQNNEFSDPWEDTETNKNDNKEERNHSSLDPSDDENKEFHAVFREKKQSRLDQRRRIISKSSHGSEGVHTEL